MTELFIMDYPRKLSQRGAIRKRHVPAFLSRSGGSIELIIYILMSQDDNEESDKIDNFFRSPSGKNSTNLIEKRQKLNEYNEADIEESEVIFTLCSIITIQIETELLLIVKIFFQTAYELQDNADSDLDTPDHVIPAYVYYSHHHLLLKDAIDNQEMRDATNDKVEEAKENKVYLHWEFLALSYE